MKNQTQVDQQIEPEEGITSPTVEAFTRKSIRFLETDCEEAYRDIDWQKMYKVARALFFGNKVRARSLVTRINNCLDNHNLFGLRRLEKDIHLLLLYEDIACHRNEDLTSDNLITGTTPLINFGSYGLKCLELTEGYLVEKGLLKSEKCLLYNLLVNPRRRLEDYKTLGELIKNSRRTLVGLSVRDNSPTITHFTDTSRFPAESRVIENVFQGKFYVIEGVGDSSSLIPNTRKTILNIHYLIGTPMDVEPTYLEERLNDEILGLDPFYRNFRRRQLEKGKS